MYSLTEQRRAWMNIWLSPNHCSCLQSAERPRAWNSFPWGEGPSFVTGATGLRNLIWGSESVKQVWERRRYSWETLSWGRGSRGKDQVRIPTCFLSHFPGIQRFVLTLHRRTLRSLVLVWWCPSRNHCLVKCLQRRRGVEGTGQCLITGYWQSRHMWQWSPQAWGSLK